MSRPWFRLYSEFVSDPKVQLLSFDDQRHFIALLCLKCNDTLDSKANPELRERMIARALGLDPATSVEVKRRLVSAGLIRENWHPKQWDARQYESDLSSSRTAAYRQRLKNKSHSDGAVTSQERTRSDTEQIQNRTEQSQEPRAKRSTATRLPDDFALTPQRREVCEAESLDPDRTFAKFVNYWRSASGAKARKLDWDATWRNWCLTEGDRRPSYRKPEPVITWRPPPDGKPAT